MSGTLGNAALLLLIMQLGWLKGAFRLLANVGQTALSNYILTSLVMQTLFVWSPLHWYGYLPYYKACAVVLCMWVAIWCSATSGCNAFSLVRWSGCGAA